MIKYIDDNGTVRPMTEEEIKELDSNKYSYFESIGYDETVNALIRERFSQSKEFSVLRKRYTHPEEFEEYNAFCEECKSLAKSIFEQIGGDDL